MNLLSVLEQNPDVSWQDLLGQVEVVRDSGGIADLAVDDKHPAEKGGVRVGNDEFTSFKL